MANQVKQLQLPDSIVSSLDLADLIDEAKNLVKTLRQNIIKARVSAKTDGRSGLPVMSDALRRVLESSIQLSELNPDVVEDIIETLEGYMSDSRKITFVLAELPNHKLKTNLTAWSRNNLSSKILVDFKLNREILGGMVVIMGSHIYDWSIRSYIVNGKPKLMEILSRV